METDARQKIIQRLAAEQRELERQAAELERQAQELDESIDAEANQKLYLVTRARGLRAHANELGLEWTDMEDDEVQDDDRGGIL
jgi:peptidoglycan hydrolase CwlO-like protein